MLKRLALCIFTVTFFLTLGCNRKSPPSTSAAKSVNAAAAMPTLATHLGFATRVPRDADVFISGYHANETLRDFATTISGMNLPEGGNPTKDIATTDEEFARILSYVGNEAFMFVGAGAGAQLEMIGESYRKVSSAWAGISSGLLLDSIANKSVDPDFSGLGERLSEQLLEKWLDALEKNSRLQVPSIVLGWKPSPDKLTECLNETSMSLERILASTPEAKPISFEASSTSLVGYEISGREIFGEFMEKTRKELSEQKLRGDLLKQLSPERIERLLSAMENLRVTIATGSVDDRVVIYLGNGKEGFRLAMTPAESLAATADLGWTHEFSTNRIYGAVYISEPMVRSVLPWLDSSDFWKSMASAVRPPIRDERLIRGILTSMADNRREAAKRSPSAWSAIFCEDAGLRYESRGGWPDPALDYETPLLMTRAAIAANPAIRAHWVQNRGQRDLAWKQLEIFGLLLDSAASEFKDHQGSISAMSAAAYLPRLGTEVREINRAYRDEFSKGIGDEVALVADFQGELPALPGLSAETLKNAKVPRFVIARPINDRALIDAAGKSYAQSWRSLTAWACELSGENLPLILPQSLESNGQITWYPPLPFIGGDFIPGVTMDDDLWIIGTSKSMSSYFSKNVREMGQGDDFGMIVEIDFASIRTWLEDTYQQNKPQADALTEDAPQELSDLANKENLEQLRSLSDRLKSLGYRKWMADGKPRSSLHLRLQPR